MIIFKNKNNYLKIDLLSLEDDKTLPSYEDARIMISVSSNEFFGKNASWVSAKSFKEFCSNLIALEKNRFGEAALKSMSQDELDLKIFSIDSLGHIGIKGLIGHNIFSENISFHHCIKFGFEFDPSQLITAVKESWVKQYAGPSTATL
jgi:hypothetical protein